MNASPDIRINVISSNINLVSLIRLYPVVKNAIYQAKIDCNIEIIELFLSASEPSRRSFPRFFYVF